MSTELFHVHLTPDYFCWCAYIFSKFTLINKQFLCCIIAYNLKGKRTDFDRNSYTNVFRCVDHASEGISEPRTSLRDIS